MIGKLTEVMDDMEKGVTNFCNDGKCIGCGNCCSNFLPLSSSEIKEIKRYVKKKHIKPTIRIAPTTTPTVDLICPFLDDEKSCEKCKIYPVRPMICREFKCDTPLSKIRKDKKLFWSTKTPTIMSYEFFGDTRGLEHILGEGYFHGN